MTLTRLRLEVLDRKGGGERVARAHFVLNPITCYDCYTMKRNEMETLAHRELRNRSSDVLRRVQEGATFQITNHGEVVAVISPAGTRPDIRVRRAGIRGGFASLPRARIEGTVQDHLDDLRGER